MARQRSSRGFARAPQRRLTSWFLGPGGDDLPTLDIQAFSSNTTLIIGSGITPLIDNLTIVRTRGHLEFILESADALRSGFNWVAGIGIVTSDAFAVGVSAVPNPFDDADWPGWLWYASGGIHSPSSTAIPTVGDQQTVVDNPIVEIDSKAMRKLRVNEVMFLSVQGGETGTAVMSVRGMTRVLVKLP